MPPAIRRARSEDLPAAAALLAETLRFADRDAVPAWLMRTTDECGGVTLVAVSDGTVVGASYAFPGRVGDAPFLFSCGLAVAPGHRDRGLGLELKREQGRQAVSLGYESIRWTTDPINGRALRVYLSGLGALIIGYRAALHDGLREDPGHPLDDVEIVWHPGRAPQLDRHDPQTVELPWAADLEHRVRVRLEMTELLAAGYVGSAVELDREARRCAVVFARRLP